MASTPTRPEVAREIAPRNIVMLGPTGVGKTEIARRMAGLVKEAFVKVEATKFTEVGYVGRDVESMIRDLWRIAIDHPRGSRRTWSDPGRTGREGSARGTSPGELGAARGGPRTPGTGGLAARTRKSPREADACMFDEHEVETEVREKLTIPNGSGRIERSTMGGLVHAR